MKKFVLYVLCNLVCFNFMVVGRPIIATANLNDGLIAYWSFDDCTFNDKSDNHFNGELYGDLECVKGVYNNAFRFKNHSKVKVSEDLLNGVTTLTVNFWIKTTDGTAGILSVANRGKDNEFTIFLTSNPFQQLRIISHQQEVDTSIDIADSNWHMLSILISRNKITVYKDGRLEFTKNEGFNTPVIAEGIWFGTDQDCVNGCWEDSNYFEGLLDEMRIYNRILSEDEIQELFASASIGQNDDAFEAGKQYCIENPSACGITDRYEEGIEKGKELCREDPSTCGIDLECENNDNSMCEASFNLFTNTLHIPCLRMGDSYWLDLSLISSDPVQLEMSGFGKNE